MGYNVIDIINKSIDIAIKRRTVFEKIGKEKCDIPFIKVMSKVLVKEVDKTIQYYETLKNELGSEEIEEIDFVIYDKISFLINEFNEKICISEISSVREYLKFSLDLEKKVYSLLLDIQGRFVRNANDIHTKTYKILSEIINNIDRLASLEKTLKEKNQ